MFFSEYSTLYINIKKSEIAWMGPEKQRSEQHLNNMENFKCVDLDKEAIKILGINFTYNTNLFNKLNFERVEANLTTTLNIWRQRNLTIYGKCEIIRTLAVSKILYVTNVLCPKAQFIKIIKNKLCDFIWNGKRPKIKYNSLISDYQDGGIKRPDIETKIKTQQLNWIKKLLNCSENASNTSWSIIPRMYLDQIGGVDNIRSKFDINRLPENIPQFYKVIFRVWSEFASCIPDSYDQIALQIVWNNKFISIRGESVFVKRLYTKGIYTVKDLYLSKESIQNDNDYKELYLSWKSVYNACRMENGQPHSEYSAKKSYTNR